MADEYSGRARTATLGRGALGAAALAWLLGAALSAPPSAQPRQPSASCRVTDSNLALDLYLPLARDGTGNAARGMRGRLDIHHQKVARERRRWDLDDKLPAQFWNLNNELKVRLLLAPPGEALVELVIETQDRHGTGVHAGTFRLSTGEGVRVQGRLECVVG